MDHFDCAKVLVENGADCNIITKQGWNLVQESVSTGNTELIKLIMTYRDYQRTIARTFGIPELLNRLKEASDFYVEMKWEFTSWIPLVSKACPSDVYKIYKRGSSVRIDTTLIGFNGSSWERGDRSYIFQASNDASMATFIEIDHVKRTYHIDTLKTSNEQLNPQQPDDISYFEPDDGTIETKLTAPNIVNYMDIEKIEFERNRSGLFGWRSDRNDQINGYDCKVYTANNLQLITKTRVEHLDNERVKAFLNEIANDDDSISNEMSNDKQSNLPGFLSNFFQGNEQKIKIEKVNKKLTASEYFQRHVNVDYYLNGTLRKIDENHKIQTFNATLSLCDSYPLSLQEQVLPIVDLMALNNSHFKKLKEFITLQLPSGFPVKIEIPLYRVITAKVTFGNINANDRPVDYVQNSSSMLTMYDSDSSSPPTPTTTTIKDTASLLPSVQKVESSAGVKCQVDECVFEIPANYRCSNIAYDMSAIGAQFQAKSTSNNRPTEVRSREFGRFGGRQQDEDDVLLQLAIQQSLAASELGTLENSGNLPSFEEYSQTNEDMILQR
jgi:ankyrin repeat domain-containing protein 13